MGAVRCSMGTVCSSEGAPSFCATSFVDPFRTRFLCASSFPSFLENFPAVLSPDRLFVWPRQSQPELKRALQRAAAISQATSFAVCRGATECSTYETNLERAERL